MNNYFYDGTEVLKNKLGVKVQRQLDAAESELSMKALLTNLHKIVRLDPQNLDTLFKIHLIMFNEVYAWAGEYRTVNMSKGDKSFHPFELFGQAEKSVRNQLKNPKTFLDIMEIYNDVNHMHPFREGNGRATRVWINLLTEKVLNKHIDWSQIAPAVYMDAMKSDDPDVLEKTFKPHLASVDNANYETSLFNQNIASYSYENVYFSDEQKRSLLQIVIHRWNEMLVGFAEELTEFTEKSVKEIKNILDEKRQSF